jgi:hypothetical protein
MNMPIACGVDLTLEPVRRESRELVRHDAILMAEKLGAAIRHTFYVGKNHLLTGTCSVPLATPVGADDACAFDRSRDPQPEHDAGSADVRGGQRPAFAHVGRMS